MLVITKMAMFQCAVISFLFLVMVQCDTITKSAVVVDTAENSTCPIDGELDGVRDNISATIFDVLFDYATNHSSTSPTCGVDGCRRVAALNMTSSIETETVTEPWASGYGDRYRLEVDQDVSLERPNTNLNYIDWLIVGQHKQYPIKRSLVQFQNLPSSCSSIKFAKMYLYYLYSHKPSWHTVYETPFIPRPLQVYQVNKEWKDAEATSSKRLSNAFWNEEYLKLDGSDAGPNGILCSPVTIFTNRPAGFVELDITEVMCNWMNGAPNYGLLVMATNENELGRDTRFASNAHSDPDKHAFVNVLCD